MGMQCHPLPEPDAPAPSEASLEFTMEQHFDEVSEIKNALISGELDTVHEVAERLVARQSELEVPLAWRPHTTDLLQAAQAVVDAPDLATAASRSARVASRCGACHVALDATPTFPEALEPPEDDSVRAQMERHRWATDRLWEGIVGPSEVAWIQGSEMFPRVPGCGTTFEGDSETFQALCTKVVALGGRARHASHAQDRVRLYGEILGTCAACHQPATP